MAKSRKPVVKEMDKKIFSHTASKTKKINLGSYPMRGGIRL